MLCTGQSQCTCRQQRQQKLQKIQKKALRTDTAHTSSPGLAIIGRDIDCQTCSVYWARANFPSLADFYVLFFSSDGLSI
jgi:hypothetical protein